ncbi:MAG TPA: hydantoinase/oxoprolinase family protein, partial [Reyranella sp.]
MPAAKNRYAVGIDVGGTFTDLVLADLGQGHLHRFKTLTTPSEPHRGILTGLDALTEQVGIKLADLGYIVHATTLVTNAIIERKGAPTGLLTTSGMADVLEIGREYRYDLYDLYLDKPAPLVPRHLRLEVTERIRANGEVLDALDMSTVDAAAKAYRAEGVSTIAVCLINSYRNPAHELAIKAHLAANYPEFDVSISSEVSREAGEFERSSTTVANAYVRPLVRAYLGRLQDELAERGYHGEIEIMLSDGGVCSIKTASQLPVRLIESGPAAGVRAAIFMAEQLDLKQVVSFDVGGTTAKISFVDDGQPAMSTWFEAARVDRARQGSGLPLQIPTVELLEIGAGGGSIASTDRLGLLKVGPESTGADPGPASYGRGGTEPTITDANLLLGSLSPAVFGFGALSLDMNAARAAMARLAKSLGTDETATPAGVFNLVNGHMVNATRLYSAERGRDLGGYTIVAYGGGGPVHAYELARILGVKRIVYPWGAGTLSAFGLLMSPRSMSVSRSWPVLLADLAAAEARKIISELEDECFANLSTTGTTRSDCTPRASVTMRYAGQAHELQVALDATAIEAWSEAPV